MHGIRLENYCSSFVGRFLKFNVGLARLFIHAHDWLGTDSPGQVPRERMSCSRTGAGRELGWQTGKSNLITQLELKLTFISFEFSYSILTGLGYNKVRIYSGSFIDWVRNGGEVVKRQITTEATWCRECILRDHTIQVDGSPIWT